MICFGISGQPPTSWACWRTQRCPSWPRTTWGSTLEQIFWNESGWVPFDNMPEGIFWQSPTLWARWQSQMCPFWSPKCVHLDPEKKGPGRTRHLVRALSKCPRGISIPWNRLQCWPTGTKSYTVVQIGRGQVGHVLIVSKALCPGECPETLSWHPFETSILLSF